MSFNIGDTVRVSTNESLFVGKIGTVSMLDDPRDWVDYIGVSGISDILLWFSPNGLDLVDAKCRCKCKCKKCTAE
jgi:hypothetical protein